MFNKGGNDCSFQRPEVAREIEAGKGFREVNGNRERNRDAGRGEKGGDILLEKLEGNENVQILFVGSLNCLRHRPYRGIAQLMQEEKASILCPTMSDFSSGRYVTQIEEAIIELSRERNTRDFILTCGCQWVILSTDGDLIQRQLKDQYDINLTINVGDHLEFGDRQ